MSDWKKEHGHGLGGAENCYRMGEYYLALWDHAQCHGWQVYRLARPNGKAQRAIKWFAGGGADSLTWKIAEAKAWAENIIKALPIDSR